MDEITLLGAALPDAPPPTPEAVARARARLTAHGVRRRPRVRLRPWAWTTITATATAVVVLAVTIGVGGMGGPATTVATSPSGKQALLDLADRAERVPAGTGAYWHKMTVDGFLQRPLIEGGEPYLIYATTERTSWHPRDAGTSTLRRARTQGRPARPQDESRWRTAGSPGQWRYAERCLPDERCEPVKVTAAPGECRYASKVEPGAIQGGTWNGSLTLADLDSIPTALDALRNYVRGHYDWQVRNDVAAESFEETQSLLGAWLLQLPARPELQATVLRMLAELPGTEVLGETADPLGRIGLGIRINKPGRPLSARVGDDPMSTDWQLILDRQTGQMLALQDTALHDLPDVAKGTVVSYTLFLEQGWTDQRPERLEGCRKVVSLP